MALRFCLVLLMIAACFFSACKIGVNGEVCSAENCAVNGINEIVNNKKLQNCSFLGLVVPNSFELAPLLQSPSFVADPSLPYVDFSGRRFRFGKVENKNVVIVMTGLGMLNAGIATELLLSLFKVESVLHFGIAGNADSKLHIGDVVIPQYWAHTGLWNWQRYGDGPNDELALESNGDYTRKFGHLKFSDYKTQNNTKGKNSTTSENLLNNVWYQPEEIFPVDGTPEIRQHAFWVPVDGKYYELAKKLEGMKLEGCVNSTCLQRPPMVVRVARGCSADIFVDNAAYREFLHSKFDVTPLDMESAAVALVCLQHKTPFITIRALSDLAGGGSAESNEADVFASLAAQNAVKVLLLSPNGFWKRRMVPAQGFTLSNGMINLQHLTRNLIQWRRNPLFEEIEEFRCLTKIIETANFIACLTEYQFHGENSKSPLDFIHVGDTEMIASETFHCELPYEIHGENFC